MFDCVILGSGAAALTTALNVSDDINVLIITKSIEDGSNTKLAQGGIAASWNSTKEQIKSHIEDTMIAGSYTNNIDVVTSIIEKSSSAIDFLINAGVNFDKCDGQYDLTCEGAHSERRIFHAGGDQTGKIIYEQLLNEAMLKKNITISDKSMIVDVTASNGCYTIMFKQNNKSYQITTENLVIGCGGYASLFKQSSNAPANTGISLFIAHKLNLQMSNLHLVQFHPTGYRAKNGHYHLLTESLRGEGARLWTKEAGYFMNKYHKLADIAPRDVTARAIRAENNCNHTVYIDCSCIVTSEELYTRFPTVYKITSQDRYDMKTDKIPVVPVAHYCIGGIDINEHGQTSDPNVYAVGECTHSEFHGSNRLASNSLLECVVLGQIVGMHITKKKRYKIERGAQLTQVSTKCMRFIENILSKYCVIVRNKQELKKAIKQISRFKSENENDEVMLAVCMQIVESCLSNQSSGCHYIEEISEEKWIENNY